MLKDLNITAIVLSGGQGKRVAGRDKGLIRLKDKPLIEWVMDAIEPQVTDIVISANRNIEEYKQLGYSVVSDDLSTEGQGYQGPLAGILSCWRSLKTTPPTKLLIAPCDSPILPNDYVAVLDQRLDSANTDVAVVHDGQRTQNLHCLIRTSVMPSMQSYYQYGERSMHRWLAQQNVSEVDFSHQTHCFNNLNDEKQMDTIDKQTSDK